MKKVLSLPTRTINSFFHLHGAMGGLCLVSVEDNLETNLILKVMKVLFSKDRLLSDLSWGQLKATATKRTGQPQCNVEDMMNFLNSAPRNEASGGDVRSVWYMVHKSLALLGMKLDHDQDGLSLEFQGDLASHWRPVTTLLKRAKGHRRLQQVLTSQDQGRSAPFMP